MNAPHNHEGIASWCAMVSAWLRPKLEAARAHHSREVTIPIREIEKLVSGLDRIASRLKGGAP